LLYLSSLLALSLVALLVLGSRSLERLLCCSISGLPHLTELLDDVGGVDVLVRGNNLSALGLAEEQVGRGRTLGTVSLLGLLAALLGSLLARLLVGLLASLLLVLLGSLLLALLGDLLDLGVSDCRLLEELGDVLDHVSLGAAVDAKEDAEVAQKRDATAVETRLHASTVVPRAVDNAAELTEVLLHGEVLRGHAESKVVQGGKSLVCALACVDLIGDCSDSTEA